MPSTGTDLREKVGKAMAEVSVWADEQESSARYHYSHTPFHACDGFVFERDCNGGKCLVTGIDKYIAEASDITVDSELRVEAVKYLIHLVADANQPLHTGFKEDVGATKIQVIGPTMTNLHVFWDFDLPAEYRKGEPVRDIIGDLPLETIAAAIVTQTTKLTCEKGYKDETGRYLTADYEVVLSKTYVKDRARVAGLQLKRAAHYLAQILNHVAGKWMAGITSLRGPKPVTPVTTAEPVSFEDEYRFVGFAADLLPEFEDFEASGAVRTQSRARKERTEIQGVDLETIKLEKYGESIVIVGKNEKFHQFGAQDFDVMFGTVSQEVFVDKRAFPGKLTGNDISRIFSYFKKEAVAVVTFEKKIDLLFRRAGEEKIPTSEKVANEPFTGSNGGPIYFRIGSTMVLLNEDDIKRDRVTFVASEVATEQGRYLLLMSADTNSKFDEVFKMGIEKFAEKSENEANIVKLRKENMRFLHAVRKINSLIFGTVIPVGERIPDIIKELVRVRRDIDYDWECIELAYSRRKRVPEDYIVFPLGPEGTAVAAKKDLRGTKDLVFEVERISEGFVLYRDERMIMTEEVVEVLRDAASDDVEVIDILEQLPQSRQVVALLEADAVLCNRPTERRAFRKYRRERDKDGKEVKLHILLKGNGG
jgi:hypothetical protein